MLSVRVCARDHDEIRLVLPIDIEDGAESENKVFEDDIVSDEVVAQFGPRHAVDPGRVRDGELFGCGTQPERHLLEGFPRAEDEPL